MLHAAPVLPEVNGDTCTHVCASGGRGAALHGNAGSHQGAKWHAGVCDHVCLAGAFLLPGA
jgi:hypothetical protein